MQQKGLHEYGERVLSILRVVLKNKFGPMSRQLAQEFGKDPFIILMSCLLSLRARDTATYPVCRELFKEVKTPQDLLLIPIPELERKIRSIGFFRRKAVILHSVSAELINRFDGNVPNTETELLSIYGIGRKTANLVLAEGFGKPAICVDVHVHRIANQLGLVQTKTPEQTEYALQKIFPQQDWRDINRYLVLLGQCPKKEFTTIMDQLSGA